MDFWSKLKKWMLYAIFKVLAIILSRETFRSGYLCGHSKDHQYSYLDIIEAYINLVRASFLMRTGGSLKEIERLLRQAYLLGRGNLSYNFCAPYLVYLWERGRVSDVDKVVLSSTLKSSGLSFRNRESLLMLAFELGLPSAFEKIGCVDAGLKRGQGCILPLAEYRQMNGGDGASHYRVAMRVIDAIKKTKTDKIFESLFLSNSICVVGNSPNVRGAGQGDFIDSHDVVVRFNNCSVGGNNALDVGRLTTVWARSGAGDVHHEVPLGAKFVLWEEDYFRSWCDGQFINYINGDLDSGKIVGCVDLEVREWVKNNCDILKPSTGLLVLGYLYCVRGSFQGVSIVGFSTEAEDSRLQYSSKAKSSRLNILHHNWGVEKNFIEKMKAGEV